MKRWGGVDFLYFGNKSEDEIFFLEREGLNERGVSVEKRDSIL